LIKPLLKPNQQPRKRKPIRKKTNARRLNQVADLLVREQVFERDGRRCVRCGKTDVIAASHVLPKGKYPRLRFLLINLKTLCLGCHLFWWHKDPVSAGEWFVKTYPERWEQLQILKDTAPKVNIKELIEELRAQ
jgi:5-methylcytosine-specific restriction endonuclease McrA